MNYNAGAAMAAGLIGALAMTVVLYLGIATVPRKMNMNLLYVLGTMVFRNTGAAYVTGIMMHAAMGVIFAFVYAGLYQAFTMVSNMALWGLLFGFVHFWVAGRGMGALGKVHPLMRSGELQSPGAFLENHPPMTRMGFLVIHLLYGLLVSVLYRAWA